MLLAGKTEPGAVRTYPALFARGFIDLTPSAASVDADRDSKLNTGPNLAYPATVCGHGVIITQVDEVANKVLRVAFPGSWPGEATAPGGATAPHPSRARPDL